MQLEKVKDNKEKYKVDYDLVECTEIICSLLGMVGNQYNEERIVSLSKNLRDEI